MREKALPEDEAQRIWDALNGAQGRMLLQICREGWGLQLVPKDPLRPELPDNWRGFLESPERLCSPEGRLGQRVGSITMDGPTVEAVAFKLIDAWCILKGFVEPPNIPELRRQGRWP